KKAQTGRFVQGKGLNNALASPWDLALYPSEDTLMVAMAGTHQLWAYNLTTQDIKIHAGSGYESIEDGDFPHNSFSQPSGLSVQGRFLYLVDSETSSLRRFYDKYGTKVETLMGTGLFDFGYKEGKHGAGRMQHPIGVYADESGVYVAD